MIQNQYLWNVFFENVFIQEDHICDSSPFEFIIINLTMFWILPCNNYKFASSIYPLEFLHAFSSLKFQHLSLIIIFSCWTCFFALLNNLKQIKKCPQISTFMFIFQLSSISTNLLFLEHWQNSENTLAWIKINTYFY